MRLGLKLTGVLTHIDFGGVGWLSDYRTSLSLKGERLFHTKIHDYLTMVRKKTLRLLATTISAGTLRLLFALIGYRAKARKEMRREPPVVPRRTPLDCPAGLRVPAGAP